MTKPYKCRVEYLTSDGNQYIDMGVGVKANTVFKAIFSVASTSTGRSYFGARNSSNERFQIVNSIGIGGGYYLVNSVYPIADKKYEIEMRASGEMYLDGVKRDASTGTFSQVSFERNLWLFATNYYDSSVGGGASTFWKAQIFEGDTIVRDFIPVIDNNGRPALYDNVSGQLFYNQGSGEFTYGRKIIPVEYLESTGTQYIDTGIVGDLSTEINCEAAIVEAGNASVTNITGNNVTSSRAITINMSANVTNPSPSRIRFGNTDNTTIAGTVNLNTFYKYNTNKTALTVKDTNNTILNTYAFNATTAFTTNRNILIYKLGDTSTQYIGKIKVSSASIKNSGVLVRDFIPCIDENNVPFMFDLVNCKIYENAGTGQFKVGANVEKSGNKNFLRKKLALMLATLRKKRPYYCEVEYLESTGTQWIDTGVKGKNNLDFDYKAVFTNVTTSVGYGIGGEWQSGNSLYLGLIRSNGTFAYHYGNTVSPVVVLNSVSANTPYVIKGHMWNGEQYMVINGTKSSVGTVSGTFTATENIALFRVSSASPIYSYTKIYYLKIWDNGVLARDMIPVLDWDMTPCMYDKVSGQFFYNQGAGTFQYGREIHYVDYLESTGTQYIDTGVKLTNNHSVEIDYQLTQAVQNRKGLFGGLGTGASKRFGALLSPSNNQLECGYGSGNEFYQLGLPDTKRHIIKQQKNLLYFDGALIYTFGTATFTHDFNAPLGNFNFTNYNPASAKYYSSKWWDGETLVRDYLPAIDENGVGFMFDKVTHTIYDAVGTGAFKYPAREVEYLEGTGTQYIDTGVNADSDLGFDMTYQLNDLTLESIRWGAIRQTNSSTYLRHHPSIEIATQNYKYFLQKGSITTLPKDTDKHNIKLDSVNKIFTVDGTSSGISFGTFDCNLNYFLFARNQYLNNTSIIEYANMKFYRCKLYNLSVLVRDYIPCFQDGQAGMLDKQNNVFYPNAGTGTFSYGRIKELEYES